jgi:hypothetical protein
MSWEESGGGPPQSKTLARKVGRVTPCAPSGWKRMRSLARGGGQRTGRPTRASVLDCASPLALCEAGNSEGTRINQ